MAITSDELSHVVSGFLRQHFHKQPPGVLARWCGESREYSYALRSLVAHQANGHFPGWTLVRVTAAEDFLWRRLQGGGSVGVFGVQARDVVSLTPEHPENLVRVLNSATQIRSVPPEVVAALCCEVLLSRPNADYSVLNSSADIQEWYPAQRGYVLNDAQWRGCKEQVCPPRWEGDASQASVVWYALVSGFQSYRVCRVTVKLAQGAEVACTEDAIVERVFSSMPVVRR